MKKWFKKCPFCANDIEEESLKCSFCDEILNWVEATKNTITYNTDNLKKNKKTWIIILWIIWCLLILWILAYMYFQKTGKESWQWIYYPEWLTHTDWEESYGPIFSDYKSCEEWWLEQLNEKLRDSMCASECNQSEEWTPICDNIVRSRKLFPSSKIYKWAEEIRNNIIKQKDNNEEGFNNEEETENIEIINKEIEEINETEDNTEEQSNKEWDKWIIIEEKQAKKENKKNKEEEKKNNCDNIKSEINKQISEIESKKSNVFCSNLNNKYESIRQLENKKNNVKYEAVSMYNEGDSSTLESTIAQLRDNYQSQIDSLYWEISNQNINECNQEKENNKKYDEMISQLKQSVKTKWCNY